VDETWPVTGVETSFYSRDKAAVEALLDRFEGEHPTVRVVRLRPGLIFSRDAASEIRRLFAGPLLPAALVRPRFVPFVPRVDRLEFQALHSKDAARAYRLALTGEARGAFNLAAEPVIATDQLRQLFRAPSVRLPARVLRMAAEASFRLHLQPSEPGWLDMALGVPLMDTSRARAELGWSETRSSLAAFAELLDGLREGAGLETPPLQPGGAGPLRLQELLSGVGSRLG
jgi:nucleoside-diphosphate-sugar epimerase